MGLDIKIPIGLMFTLLGLILALFGIFTSGNAIYESSLDINLNLWTGLFMILFGMIMLLASDIFKKGKLEDKVTLDADEDSE